MKQACWFGLRRNIHGRPGKSRRKVEIEPVRGRSLPCSGWRLQAGPGVSRPLREAREARRLRGTPVERAKIGSGREIRPDGKHPASRARLFDPEPHASAHQGRTLRELCGALSRSPGCTGAGEAWKVSLKALPEQQPCAASSSQSPGMQDQRLVPQRPEPHPAPTTDASGASLVRPDS